MRHGRFKEDACVRLALGRCAHGRQCVHLTQARFVTRAEEQRLPQAAGVDRAVVLYCIVTLVPVLVLWYTLVLTTWGVLWRGCARRPGRCRAAGSCAMLRAASPPDLNCDLGCTPC